MKHADGSSSFDKRSCLMVSEWLCYSQGESVKVWHLRALRLRSASTREAATQ